MIDVSLQNELRDRFNPDGSRLRELQLYMLEMLKFIDKVCKDNNIKYWLSSGTCLGAVRHRGFIPWDDDIDIEMFPEDYNRFCSIVMKMDSHKYVLQTSKTDPEYAFPYAKLRDLNTVIKENSKIDLWYKYKGVFIDIFPVYYSSSWIIAKTVNLLQNIGFYKLPWIRNAYARRLVRNINKGFLHKFIFPILIFFDKFGYKNKLRIGGLGSGFMEQYDKDYVCNLVRCDFEGLSFPIPSKYDQYLTSLYGNYMELPQMDSIQAHITNVSFLKGNI